MGRRIPTEIGNKDMPCRHNMMGKHVSLSWMVVFLAMLAQTDTVLLSMPQSAKTVMWIDAQVRNSRRLDWLCGRDSLLVTHMRGGNDEEMAPKSDHELDSAFRPISTDELGLNKVPGWVSQLNKQEERAQLEDDIPSTPNMRSSTPRAARLDDEPESPRRSPRISARSKAVDASSLMQAGQTYSSGVSRTRELTKLSLRESSNLGVQFRIAR
jgi:hypothetical protein